MGQTTLYELGRWESVTRTVTAKDVERFAEATGDTNPVHLDEGFAATTRFKHRRVVHLVPHRDRFPGSWHDLSEPDDEVHGARVPR